MIRNLLALTGLLAIALISAVGLQAYGYFDENDDPPRVRVSYAGLDLGSPEGLRILEQRVNAAIDDVCRSHDGRELWRQRDRRECREDAIAGVTPQIDYAVDKARRNRARVIAEEDQGPPPPGRYDPPPPPPPVYAPTTEQPPLKLLKRTVVTTRTVTTTRPAPPPPLAPARPAWRPRQIAQPALDAERLSPLARTTRLVAAARGMARDQWRDRPRVPDRPHDAVARRRPRGICHRQRQALGERLRLSQRAQREICRWPPDRRRRRDEVPAARPVGSNLPDVLYVLFGISRLTA